MRRRAMRKPMSEINVVPYIDVTLVLLIIFMITAPLLYQGVNVDLPKAAARALKVEKAEPLIVSIDRQGNYFLNVQDPHTPILAHDLILRVAAELKRDHLRKVMIKGDGGVAYSQVVTAMVVLQQAGVPSVGLITDNTVKRV